MCKSVMLSNPAMTIEEGIILYNALQPAGWVEAHIIDPIDAKIEGKASRNACQLCGQLCPDDQQGVTWLHAVNVTNCKTKERRYHKACMTAAKAKAEVMRMPLEGVAASYAPDMHYIATLLPATKYDTKELAAALMTPNRLAGITSETSGHFYRMPSGGYISLPTRNLRGLNRRLDTASTLCRDGQACLSIFLEGQWVEDVPFRWDGKNASGQFAKKSEAYKQGFMTLIDWEVGKYRKHGLQFYNYPENVERAREERDYGQKGRERFWL